MVCSENLKGNFIAEGEGCTRWEKSDSKSCVIVTAHVMSTTKFVSGRRNQGRLGKGRCRKHNCFHRQRTAQEHLIVWVKRKGLGKKKCPSKKGSLIVAHVPKGSREHRGEPRQRRGVDLEGEGGRAGVDCRKR